MCRSLAIRRVIAELITSKFDDEKELLSNAEITVRTYHLVALTSPITLFVIINPRPIIQAFNVVNFLADALSQSAIIKLMACSFLLAGLGERSFR